MLNSWNSLATFAALSQKNTIMANFAKAFRRGTKAFVTALGPGKYAAAGRVIVCPHCHGEVFQLGSAQLNTAGLTFFNLDWANRSATTLACTNCGRIEWFAKRPERTSD